ncbi:hypothetical protein BpHYR1_028219 [Brachionus plicatilis]|uniref:Uncharacterized protein n=1 Tax=Brachionus plicatilis TaxID=10195 RepID=A0A3M7P9M9_BRAPC|nr:hypothetical protein BpHYR1_028219 [Brachionus plicatilis]
MIKTKKIKTRYKNPNKIVKSGVSVPFSLSRGEYAVKYPLEINHQQYLYPQALLITPTVQLSAFLLFLSRQIQFQSGRDLERESNRNIALATPMVPFNDRLKTRTVRTNSAIVGAPEGLSSSNFSTRFNGITDKKANQSIVKLKDEEIPYMAMSEFIDCSIFESRMWKIRTDADELMISVEKSAIKENPRWFNKELKALAIAKYRALLSMKMNPNDKQVGSILIKFPEKLNSRGTLRAYLPISISKLNESNGDLVKDKMVIIIILDIQFQQAFKRDTDYRRTITGASKVLFGGVLRNPQAVLCDSCIVIIIIVTNNRNLSNR